MVAFGAVHISSERPKELGEFYQKVLGIDPEWQSDGETSFMLGSTRLIIQSHDQVRGRNSSPERLFFDFVVPDVAAEFERMVALGAAVIQEPYPFDDNGMRLVFSTLADLDGNYFQLMSITPA
jgi:predicted enzyme related to lactoylglutathione lyase